MSGLCQAGFHRFDLFFFFFPVGWSQWSARLIEDCHRVKNEEPLSYGCKTKDRSLHFLAGSWGWCPFLFTFPPFFFCLEITLCNFFVHQIICECMCMAVHLTFVEGNVFRFGLPFIFRCAVASLYEVVSVRPSVRPSVGPYVPCYFRRWWVRVLGASCAVYPALFVEDWWNLVHTFSLRY